MEKAKSSTTRVLNPYDWGDRLRIADNVLYKNFALDFPENAIPSFRGFLDVCNSYYGNLHCNGAARLDTLSAGGNNIEQLCRRIVDLPLWEVNTHLELLSQNLAELPNANGPDGPLNLFSYTIGRRDLELEKFEAAHDIRSIYPASSSFVRRGGDDIDNIILNIAHLVEPMNNAKSRSWGWRASLCKNYYLDERYRGWKEQVWAGAGVDYWDLQQALSTLEGETRIGDDFWGMLSFLNRCRHLVPEDLRPPTSEQSDESCSWDNAEEIHRHVVQLLVKLFPDLPQDFLFLQKTLRYWEKNKQCQPLESVANNIDHRFGESCLHKALGAFKSEGRFSCGSMLQTIVQLLLNGAHPCWADSYGTLAGDLAMVFHQQCLQEEHHRHIPGDIIRLHASARANFRDGINIDPSDTIDPEDDGRCRFKWVGGVNGHFVSFRAWEFQCAHKFLSAYSLYMRACEMLELVRGTLGREGGARHVAGVLESPAVKYMLYALPPHGGYINLTGEEAMQEHGGAGGSLAARLEGEFHCRINRYRIKIHAHEWRWWRWQNETCANNGHAAA